MRYLSAPGKSTLSLVSFANYKWFEEWKDDKVNNRGAEYKELKQAFIDTCLETVMDIFPKITQDKVNTLLQTQKRENRVFQMQTKAKCLSYKLQVNAKSVIVTKMHHFYTFLKNATFCFHGEAKKKLDLNMQRVVALYLSAFTTFHVFHCFLFVNATNNCIAIRPFFARVFSLYTGFSIVAFNRPGFSVGADRVR